MSYSNSNSNSESPEGETFPVSPASTGQSSSHQPPNEILALWGQVSKIASGSRLAGNRTATVQTVNVNTLPDVRRVQVGGDIVGTAKGNALCSAIEDPLTVGGRESVAIASSQAEARATHIRVLVANCVQALDKLNQALDQERTRQLLPQDEKLDSDLAAARRLTAQLFDNLKH